MISEVDRMQAEAALNDIATRRAVLFQQYRGAIEPPPEYFGQLKALDHEAVMWREKLDDTSPPAYLPPWGRDLWTTVAFLRYQVEDFREERRRERMDDAKERDQARWNQLLLTIFFIAWLVLLTGVMWWLGSQVWRITELWR